MKIYNIIILLSLLVCSCKPTDICRTNKNYFVEVNESKPYKIDSTYCIEEGVLLNKDKTSFEITIYDRINQNIITEAVIWINNDKKVIYTSIDSEVILQEGIYDIDIVTPNNLPLKIKGLKLIKNHTLNINGYLGNSLQF